MENRNPRIFVFNDGKEIAAFLIRRWCEIAEEALDGKGFFAVALSGGTAAVDFYSQLPKLKENFRWDRTHIFLVDERFVSYRSKDSNLGLMRELFLRGINIPAGNVHAVDTGKGSASQAAELYEKELRQFFGLSGNELPAFDFVGLGIGEDGHTASLFPGGPEVLEKERLVITSENPGVRHKRISLTLPVFNNARHVIFIASGRRKAEILKRVIEEGDRSLPAAGIMPPEGELAFVIDRAAASLLNTEQESVYLK